MKTYYFKLAFSNIKYNNKKNILSIIVITLCLTVTIVCSVISNSFNTYKENLVESIVCRTIVLLENVDNTVINQIPNIKNIIDPFAENWTLGLSDSTIKFSADGTYSDKYAVLLTGYFDGLIPEVVVGENIKSDMRNVAIIPEKFQPSILIDSVNLKNQEMAYLNGKDFIGQTLTGIYSKIKDENSPLSKNNIIEYTYEFKVIGVYDPIKNHSDFSQIYIPMNDLITINNNLLPDSIDKTNQLYQNKAIVIDKFKNVESVINILSKKNIIAIKQADPSPALNTANTLSHISLFATLISLFLFTISIIIITNINTKNRRKEIGLLKTIGYTHNKIIKLMLLESAVVSLLAFLFTLLLSSFILFFLWDFLLSNIFGIYITTLKPNLLIFLILSCSLGIIEILINLICTFFSTTKVVSLNPYKAVNS